MLLQAREQFVLLPVFLLVVFILPLIFLAILLAFVSILTFCRTKSNKKAQHRQNQSYRPFAHEFSQVKISLGWALLVSNFPRRKTTRECVSLAARGAPKKTFTLLSAPFLRPLPVILTVLYFLEVTFVVYYT
jgi:hypothetical protein